MAQTPSLRRVRWKSATRVVASRFPPINLFERVSSDPSVWEALVAAEMLVSPRMRDEVGVIRLVPVEDRVSGPGATWVMAPFTYLNPAGSRFSDGSYGVYYAGNSLATAVTEPAFRFARYARDSGDGPRREAMRVLVGKIDATFHDLDVVDSATYAALLDPNSYAASRPFAAVLRASGSNGIHYPSVRHAGGYCVAAFRPKAIGIPEQSRHLLYEWDGQRVGRYFDYHASAWVALGEDV
jgi:hypothetical protein